MPYPILPKWRQDGQLPLSTIISHKWADIYVHNNNMYFLKQFLCLLHIKMSSRLVIFRIMASHRNKWLPCRMLEKNEQNGFVQIAVSHPLENNWKTKTLHFPSSETVSSALSAQSFFPNHTKLMFTQVIKKLFCLCQQMLLLFCCNWCKL